MHTYREKGIGVRLAQGTELCISPRGMHHYHSYAATADTEGKKSTPDFAVRVVGVGKYEGLGVSGSTSPRGKLFSRTQFDCRRQAEHLAPTQPMFCRHIHGERGGKRTHGKKKTEKKETRTAFWTAVKTSGTARSSKAARAHSIGQIAHPKEPCVAR